MRQALQALTDQLEQCRREADRLKGQCHRLLESNVEIQLALTLLALQRRVVRFGEMPLVNGDGMRKAPACLHGSGATALYVQVDGGPVYRGETVAEALTTWATQENMALSLERTRALESGAGR